MATLAFRLFGPMASWGSDEAGFTGQGLDGAVQRPTNGQPGAGAILGLVGAALGLGRDEALIGLDQIKVAVAAHGPRHLLNDFHTLETVKNQANCKWSSRSQALAEGSTRTTLTTRQYLTDGLWRVFLSGPDEVLARIQSGLNAPVFELYLGRRSCPLALPPDPRMVDGGLAEAVRKYQPLPAVNATELPELARLCAAIQARVLRHNQADELVWEDGFPGAPKAVEQRLTRNRPMSRTAWSFARRTENWAPLSAVKKREDGVPGDERLPHDDVASLTATDFFQEA